MPERGVAPVEEWGDPAHAPPRKISKRSDFVENRYRDYIQYDDYENDNFDEGTRNE